MFASYEVATSFPSLTAIKGYDLDKSADVPLMGHIIRFLSTSKQCHVYPISMYLLYNACWIIVELKAPLGLVREP